MADIDEATAKRLEEDGQRRFGDHWNQAIGAIGGALPPSVNAGDVVRGALREADPARALFDCGRECLIAQATEGDHDAERVYSAMRQKEREAHWASKGRVR
jgi:hypothetical protein